jgi:hypothetical protein
MGVAPVLVDTYRRYKKGTENFVQWLAETARGTGQADDVFKAGTKDNVPSSGGRLKGKARMEAKKAGLGSNMTRFVVPMKAMAGLAKAIVTTKTVEVPTRYSQLLVRSFEDGRLCDLVPTEPERRGQDDARQQCASSALHRGP